MNVAMPRRWAALLLWEQAVLPVVARRIGYDAILSPAKFRPAAAAGANPRRAERGDGGRARAP